MPLFKRGGRWFVERRSLAPPEIKGATDMTNPTTKEYRNYIRELNAAKKGTAAKKEKQSQGAKYKDMFSTQLQNANLSHLFTPNAANPKELQFHPSRKWRFDYACEREKIAVELQGGGWGNVVQCHQCHASVMRRSKGGGWFPVREGGRHQNPKSLQGEYEKLNEAQKMGWRVFLFGPGQIKDETAINFISNLISPEPLETKATGFATK